MRSISLFADHILGQKGNEIAKVRSKTNCIISISHHGNRDPEPMAIRITSIRSNPPSDVRLATTMLTESLLKFLSDRNSERRLVYELAMNARGTFNFQKHEGAVQQKCHYTHRHVWMKLVELPSVELQNGKFEPHGLFLTNDHTQRYIRGNTDCFIEVYGFHRFVPKLSRPYVLVCGYGPDEVNEVSDRVQDKLARHQEKCQCQVYIDTW